MMDEPHREPLAGAQSSRLAALAFPKRRAAWHPAGQSLLRRLTMGSLVKCAGCGKRCGTRPIGVYWRWMRADGIWKKYYHRICIGCYQAKVAPLEVTYDASENLRCPSCGIDTEEDYDAIYVTSFPTGQIQAGADAP